jgi:hypothetical protein
MIAKESCHEAEIETSCTGTVEFRGKRTVGLFASLHRHGTKPPSWRPAGFVSQPATSLARARHIGKSLLNYTDQFDALAAVTACHLPATLQALLPLTSGDHVMSAVPCGNASLAAIFTFHTKAFQVRISSSHTALCQVQDKHPMR